MSGIGGFVKDALDAGLLQRFNVGLADGAVFSASVAYEYDLDLLLEDVHVGDFRRGNAAAAEYTDVGELIKVGQGDRPGLHSTHGKTSHSPMGLIGKGAEVGINKGNQVVDKNPCESAEVESASAGTSDASRQGPACNAARSRRAGLDGRSRSATGAGSAGDIAIGHHDDEGPGFAGGNQVVHDQTGETLAAPAGFIFPAAVLQIQHRITLGQIFFIIRRGVNEAAEIGIGGLGIEWGLSQLAVGHVLDGIEVLIRGGDFEAAAPAAGAVEVPTAGVRNLGAIDNELVVVETFVLGPRFAYPGAVLALGQWISYATQIKHDALGLWRDDADADATFRVDLWILSAGLIKRRRFEILYHWRGPG